MSRCFSHGITELSRPAIPSLIGHGPSLSRLVQRPQRSSNASPALALTPAFPLPRLEILDEDAGARLEIGHALQPRDVIQHTAGHDSLLHRQHVVLLRAAVLGDKPG